MGLSMGGTLAIRLAEEHGDDVAGLVLVNPSLLTKRPDRFLLPVLRWLVPTWPGIASDIKKDGPVELAYDKIPVKAAYQLTRLWLTTRGDLDKVTQPILVFRSTEDHVVEPDSCVMLHEKVSSTDLREVLLEDSYHVATLDNDAPTIFEGSLEFVRRLATTDLRRREPGTPDATTGSTRTSYERLRRRRDPPGRRPARAAARRRVAAYSAPTRRATRPVRRHGAAPRRPATASRSTARRRDEARELADRYLAEVADELAWAGIVADFDLDADRRAAPLAGQRRRRRARRTAGRSRTRPRPGRQPVRLRGAARRRTRRAAAVSRPRERDTAEDHFEPPPPPPLPMPTPSPGSPGRRAGRAVVSCSSPRSPASRSAGGSGSLALAAFMAGFVTLVARMKDRPPTDSGPDDGAVV